MQSLVQRFYAISTQPFETVITRLEAAVGHPDINTLRKEMAAANTHNELKQVVRNAVGPSGLMEFLRFDIGAVNRRVQRTETPRSMRFLIGNPLIMQQMVVHVPDAASYAPVTVLIDERADGVHLSYDSMVGFLAPYGNAPALKVAQELDLKIEAMLTAVAT